MKFFQRSFLLFTLGSMLLALAGCQSSGPYKFDPLTGSAGPGGPVDPSVPIPAPVAGANAPVSMPVIPPATVKSSGVDPTTTLLYVGNTLTVGFSDTPTPLSPIDDVIKEDGSIILIYNQKFQAAGKTVGALQSEIRDRYVPQYFRYLTVSIKTAERFIFVGGEVKAPNRQVYSGRTTVLTAIDIAGGFGDFADKKHVRLTRANGQKFTVNCTRAMDHRELDLEVYPGDQVFVKKRIW